MKKLFLLLTLSLFILSCDKAKEEKTQEKKNSEKEIVYSENIQDTFFGVKFGASREEVIKAFEKEGFKLDNQYSTNNRLCFETYESSYIPIFLRHSVDTTYKRLAGEYFSFGGMDWHFVNAYLSNGKFYAIQFGYSPESKETALSQFESVLSALSSKYKMNEEAIEDTNTYKNYRAESKDGKFVRVLCDKSESFAEIKRYYVELIYEDATLDKPSDEL